MNIYVYIKKSYDEIHKKNPREESPKKRSTEGGYIDSHPYARYIEEDISRYVKNHYTRIIRFMNEVYGRVKYTKQRGMTDQYVLYDMFAKTKDACKNLGIHCIEKDQQLYDIIAEGDIDKISDLEIDMEIVDDDVDEPMINDIQILSLPYTVTLPTFSYAGVGETYQYPVSDPKATVWYNKSYLDKKEYEKSKENKTNQLLNVFICKANDDMYIPLEIYKKYKEIETRKQIKVDGILYININENDLAEIKKAYLNDNIDINLVKKVIAPKNKELNNMLKKEENQINGSNNKK